MTKDKIVIALGFFDGVHIGHAALLEKTKERAVEIGAAPAALTFDIHPDTLVFKKDVPLINSAADREDMIRRRFGIENVVFIHFSEKVMRMDWRVFIEELISELGICHIVVGHDFCFGYKGLGTAERLKEYCAENGLGCDIIAPVKIGNNTVSSTYIRTLIRDGKIEEANSYLGHPHVLSDTVRSGYHLGTKMGTPTINMKLPEGVLSPRFGVYATKVYLEDGSEHISVTNVGVRPTVSDENSVSVETYILDFKGNLYNRHARVEFYKFIRPERKFASQTELSEQIKADAETSKNFFRDAK